MKIFFRTFVLVMTAALLFSCSSNKEAKEENPMTAEEMMAIGDQQFDQGMYKKALETYQSLLINFPTSDLHIDAKLKIAAAYGQLEDYENQMQTLLQLLNENIIPERVPEIYTQIGKFYENFARYNPGTVTSDTTDYLKAIEYYKKAVEYENSKDNLSKAKAMYRRALVEAKIGRLNDAVAHYNFVVQNFPNSPYAVLAQVKLKDPSDTSELATDEASLEKYRETLLGGVPEQTQPAMEQAPQPQQEVKTPTTQKEAQDVLFESSKQDTTGNK